MKHRFSKGNDAKFPKRKIRAVVQTALPKGAHFRMRVIDSSIGGMKIVRVITPAWKRLSNFERIFRILNVANAELSKAELSGILRFSVLTPDELKRVTN